MMIWVFVYGTLLSGETNHHVAAPYLLKSEPGMVRGMLYDLGPYPGLVLTEDGGLIHGEWLLVTEYGLARMDELEDYVGPGENNDYDRVWVRDALKQEREGFVYTWSDSRGCPLIKCGSWRSRTVQK